MRYQVNHRTTYDYDQSVSVSHHVARLAPRNLPEQRVLKHRCRFNPTPGSQIHHTDYFGNRVVFVTLQKAHRKLVVDSESLMERTVPTPVSPSASPPWEEVREACLGNGLRKAPEACEFAFASPLVDRLGGLREYAQSSFGHGRSLLEGVLELTQRIHSEFKFDPEATTLATPVLEVLEKRHGVCQDFAHLEIGCLRSLGLPARYVSGYLETDPPPGKAKLAGADASHAWVAAFCPTHGWVDVDPTNNVIPGDRHLTVAWGRDYSDVSPIHGVLVGSGEHKLRVAVDVTPVGRKA